ncbi:MAG TPA: M1 family metallopeptidase, partial [Gemmatimonadaceae bacterium]|nr:M1 family metallopeptidase [Gemmatimonadaceae bacterium]
HSPRGPSNLHHTQAMRLQCRQAAAFSFVSSVSDRAPRRILSATAFLSLALIFPRAVSPQEDALAFRPTHYEFHIDLPDAGPSIKGQAWVTLRRMRPADTISLDLMHLHVSRVEVDRRRLEFIRTDSTILIPLPSNAPQRLEVFVVYDGVPTDGLIAGKDSAGRWNYFGDNWPNRARYWLPTIDRPDAKAPVNWTITAPFDKTVIANGLLSENTSARIGGRKVLLSRWRESSPIPPYLMVIAAAPLVKYDLGCTPSERDHCVQQAVFAAPEQQKVLPGAFSRVGDIVAFFSKTIAPFPFEKLYHLQSRTRFGGMENATAIFYADAFFHRDGVPEGIIAHETAHQWFGDAVTEQKWPHVWLSEGFADYFEALYAQHAHGDSAFRSEMSRFRSQILADTVAVPTRPVIDTAQTDLFALLNANSYQKGAWVLHMLRSQLGDTAFFGGLRDYYAAHKYGNALSDDLRSALEHTSGKDLRAFFDQWLRRPGYPEVTVTVQADSSGTVAAVRQTGRFGYYDFPLPIVVRTSGGALRAMTIPVKPQPITLLRILDRGARFGSLELDPNVTVLMRSNVEAATPRS